MTLDEYRRAVASLRARFGEDFAARTFTTNDPTEARLLQAVAAQLSLTAELLGLAAAYQAPLKEIEFGMLP